MRIRANTISLTRSLGGVFWYAVYALALFFIFASRTWFAIKDSIGITGITAQNKYQKINT
jgi:hypothetical protein